MFMYRGLIRIEICLGEPRTCSPSNVMDTSTLPGATPRHRAVYVPSAAGPTNAPSSTSLARLSGLTDNANREGSSTSATLPLSSRGVTMTGRSTRAAAPSSVPYPENSARVALVRPVSCSNTLSPTTCVTFTFKMRFVDFSRASYVWFRRSLVTVTPACATRNFTAYVPLV